MAGDAAVAVTTVGTGGATLFRMTLTVALEDEEILLLLLTLVGDILEDIPPSAFVEDPWLIPIEGKLIVLLFDPARKKVMNLKL